MVPRVIQTFKGSKAKNGVYTRSKRKVNVGKRECMMRPNKLYPGDKVKECRLCNATICTEAGCVACINMDPEHDGSTYEEAMAKAG
jgi:hypothetical protein